MAAGKRQAEWVHTSAIMAAFQGGSADDWNPYKQGNKGSQRKSAEHKVSSKGTPLTEVSWKEFKEQTKGYPGGSRSGRNQSG